jgi:hypothetical protein
MLLRVQPRSGLHDHVTPLSKRSDDTKKARVARE